MLVVQHDRPLRRPAPMGALLAAMEERHELAHVPLLVEEMGSLDMADMACGPRG